MSELKPIKHQKIYVEIAKQLSDAISKGVYKPGDKLPSERELASMLNVSRTSVREALAILDALGIINVKVGQGSFASNSLSVQNLTFKGNESPYDLIEARILFEKSLVEIIIHRATKKHIDKLEESIKEMKGHSRGGEALENCYDCGVEFHRIYAELAGNDVITNIGESLVNSARHPMSEILNRRALYSEEVRQKQIKEHIGILNAIRKKDVELTKERIENHLSHLQHEMFL